MKLWQQIAVSIVAGLAVQIIMRRLDGEETPWLFTTQAEKESETYA